MADIDPQEFGRLQATVEQLEKDVAEMSGDVKQLLAMANKGRGAFLASMTIAGFVGSVATFIAERIFK